MNAKRCTVWQLLLVLLLFAGAGHVAAREVSGPAPDFTLKSRSGENIKLSELRGQVVMLNFWASWCGPCRQEMPLLEQIYRRYQPLGFTLLGINVDEDPQAAEALLKEIPVSFPVLFDSRNQVSEEYGLVAMPSTLMVDRDGQMRFVHLGYQPGFEDDYERQIKALIRE